MIRNTSTALPVANGRVSAIPVETTIPLIFVVLPMLCLTVAVQFDAWLWCWLLPVTWFGLMPLLDRFSKNTRDLASASGVVHPDSTVTEGLTIVMGILGTVYCAFSIARVDAPLAGTAGIVGSLAVSILIALHAAHKFCHRLGGLASLLASFPYLLIASPHLRIDHVLGHHRHAATPSDPASARMGESYYKYCRRMIGGTVRRAWRIETERLSKSNPIMKYLRNQLVRDVAAMIVLAAMLAFFGGLYALAVVGCAGALAWWLFTAVGYVDHYGLLRGKRHDGEYERVGAAHAWQTSDILSQYVLFKRPLHAHHHMHPNLEPDQLTRLAASPTLEIGYGWLALVVLCPPLWFRLVDPVLANHVEQDLSRSNIDGEAYVRLMEMYHHP